MWGLGWFVAHAADILPTWAPELAAPQGMPFYYSSPLRGWFSVPLVPLLGLPAAYTIGVVAARVATVLCAYGAGRGVGLEPAGALVPAAVYGCAPFFHGYTVEGIVEGTDGWALALWVWMAAERRWALAAIAAAATVLSSWYMAMCGVLIAVAWAPWSPRATAVYVLGLAVASPALVAFLGAFDAGAPLDPEVRRAMGTTLSIFPRPGALPGEYAFAKTSWLGWIAPVLAILSARRHPWLALGALAAWLLSFGAGPLYEWPPWSSVRFPYRLHAITLLAVGILGGRTVDAQLEAWWFRFSEGGLPDPRVVAGVIPAAIVLEGLLLSPIEPIVPGAPADVPAAIRALSGRTVLSVPGPVAMPPGVVNRSRPRARYVLYWAAVAGTRTPWAPDFNGVGARGREAPVLAQVRTWDPLSRGIEEAFRVGELRRTGIDAVVLHIDELRRDALALERILVNDGAVLLHKDDTIIVLGVP